MKNTDISDMRQEILKISADLISRKGIKTTSLADISKAAGISKGTLYYYYSSKDDIIFEITDIHLKGITEDVMKWIDRIDTQMDRQDIIRIVLERISRVEARGRLHLYIVSEAITGNDNLADGLRKKYLEWRQTIRHGIQLVFQEQQIDDEAFSFVLLSIIDGLTIQWLLQTEEIPFQRIASFLVD